MATAAPAIPPLAPAVRCPSRKRALADEYPPSSAGVVEAGSRADKVGLLPAVLLPAQNLWTLSGISVLGEDGVSQQVPLGSYSRRNVALTREKKVPRGRIGILPAATSVVQAARTHAVTPSSKIPSCNLSPSQKQVLETSEHSATSWIASTRQSIAQLSRAEVHGGVSDMVKVG